MIVLGLCQHRYQNLLIIYRKDFVNNRCVDCKYYLDYMKVDYNWERFDETSLPDKESFYSSLDIENIDDIDYRHGNNVFKKFKLKNLGEYHDLYVQSDTLLLADVFENFRNMCIKVYELDPVHFLSLPGLAWKACLKNKCKIRIIN